MEGCIEGTVELGCSLGVVGAFGEGFLEGFRAKYPEVTLNEREASDMQVDRDLALGKCSLELVVSPYQRDVDVCELYCCPVCLWMRADDPLAEKALVEAEDLAHRRLAMPGPDFKCHDRLMRLADERGVELGPIEQMHDPCRLYDFARSGRGMSFTVRHLRQDLVFSLDPDVVSVPVDSMSWSFGIAHRAGRTLTPAERAFWDWCVAWSVALPCDPCCNKRLMGTCTRVP